MTSAITDWASGCGRFFEGTPAEMNTALNKTLATLPNDTKVYVNIMHAELTRRK